jgi:S1-C subfamily serine protease
LQPGDLILEVGGQKVDGIEAFYRRLWSQGDAGVVARLKVLQRSDLVEMRVTTRDRYRHYLLPGAQR